LVLLKEFITMHGPQNVKKLPLAAQFLAAAIARQEMSALT
jgi:hypothetical protein